MHLEYILLLILLIYKTTNDSSWEQTLNANKILPNKYIKQSKLTHQLLFDTK